MSIDIRPLIGIAAERPLTQDEANSAFAALFEGAATPAQIGGLLMAMRVRGETVDEMAAATGAMRSRMHRISAPEDAIDIVGTGGDGRKTLNISTAAALVAAGAGVPVAKHGNKALSSKSGSADALTELGINTLATPEQSQSALNTIGLCFMMAPVHHPAMRHVGPSRAELGTRTIFNLLGPMTNPAGVTRQLTGTFDAKWCRPMAETLREMGTTHAWLIHGSDGTDELAISGESLVVALKDGELREFIVTPEDAGLSRHDFSQISGGDAVHNANAARAIFAGERNAYRDAVLLNAAAALIIADRVSDLREGVMVAAESIDSGATMAKLDAFAKTVPL